MAAQIWLLRCFAHGASIETTPLCINVMSLRRVVQVPYCESALTVTQPKKRVYIPITQSNFGILLKLSYRYMYMRICITEVRHAS